MRRVQDAQLAAGSASHNVNGEKADLAGAWVLTFPRNLKNSSEADERRNSLTAQDLRGSDEIGVCMLVLA